MKVADFNLKHFYNNIVKLLTGRYENWNRRTLQLWEKWVYALSDCYLYSNKHIRTIFLDEDEDSKVDTTALGPGIEELFEDGEDEPDSDAEPTNGEDQSDTQDDIEEPLFS